ncbi:GNAT family N-acetyltransferase [Streptomyces nanshensis]|uniref:GNAT family N-acetyltransferase n=1 Tax=Streptomyces nanshensis TaxID=518642 RepID=UPI001495C083|nr:GNAT family N-acetyltransferase [Streptomyces nanshensis]
MNETWPTLYGQDPDATPYQAASWLSAWAAQLPPTASVLVLVTGTATEPAAAVALVREQRLGRRALVYPLGAPHAEYTLPVGPYAADSSVAMALAEGLKELARDHDVVVPDMPAESGLAQQLSAQRGWTQDPTRCAEIPLPVAYARMSSSTRREHRRRARKWGELAAERRVVYRRSRRTDELVAAYPLLSQMRQRRWAGQPEDTENVLISDEASWPAVLQRCGADLAFIAALELDGHVVAQQMCLYRDDRCYSLFPAMDPDYAELAPGHALLRWLTEDLTDDGFSLLSLGLTLETEGQRGYKRQYLPRERSCVTFCRLSSR